ncbi:MAG: tRNA (adenosine(37)-N6)-dimethylallyltransferase MiaA [Bacteroidia bacterium]|nr:tRNA (adenosine(37)-N6)-dimethylallyltransferase MiaA [Bacteroidia bacterium]
MKYVICIIGPTAVGKSALSLELADRLKAEIISSDSRQMYRYLDIGTAKASEEELGKTPHHFINNLDPDQAYNAADFEKEAENRIKDLHKSSDVAIVVGGSTLYMDALWYGFDEMPEIDPEVRRRLMQEHKEQGLGKLLKELEAVDPLSYEKIDQQNHARVIRALEVYRSSGKPISFYRKGKKAKKTPWTYIKIGLTDERKPLYKRIDKRVLEMIEAGLEDEVKSLLKTYGSKAPALQSIGYSEMISYLEGEIDLAEAIRLIQRNSRRYAKRQFTWFRRYEDIQWFEAGQFEEIWKWLQIEMEN